MLDVRVASWHEILATLLNEPHLAFGQSHHYSRSSNLWKNANLALCWFDG